MKDRPLSLDDQMAAIRAIRLLGDEALPCLRRIVEEIDRRAEDRRLRELVEEEARRAEEARTAKE